MKKTLTAFILVTWILEGSVLYCQAPPQEEIKFAKGQVVAVDWVANKLVVDTHSFGGPDQITFVVPDKTPINKGNNTISLANINVCDMVSVEYYSSFSGAVTTHISVVSHDASF
jgi:hypothetical protein